MNARSLLTPAQRRIALAIADSELKHRPQFVSELVERLGLAAESSLTPTLKIMVRKELIEIIRGGKQLAFRVVRLTPKAKNLLGLGGGLPLLGSIPAGPLAEVLTENVEMVETDSLLSHRSGDFLLRAAGDSMIGDGIFNGDLVLLRPNIDVLPGEIAAIQAGEAYESTLKHVHFEARQVRLKASNPTFADILIPLADWRGIAGVFRGLVRNVSH